MTKDPDRRTALRLTACALGGGAIAAAGVPLARVLVDAAGKTTVTSPKAPIDLGTVDRLAIGGPPVSLAVIAPSVRDGWNAQQNVVLGSAWISRTGPSQCTALSSVCPHLACAVGWDEGKAHFVCPCHESLFTRDGAKVSGPSERGLDPLPISIVDGRIQLTWTRYRIGGATREPV